MSTSEKETFTRPPAARIRARQAEMTPAMSRVAEAVAADAAGCARLSVTELAARTGTSEATVVRTARLLGYPGYRDLRLALAEDAARRPAPVPAVTGDIAVDDPLAEVIAKLARDGRRTLADTLELLDPERLAAAVAAIASARRIEVFGIGASGLVAQDLMQKLQRIGLLAQAHADPHLALTAAVQLRPGDVAVAVSDSGATQDVLEPLTRAAGNGATSIALTARPDSPLARAADLVLATSSGYETSLRPAALASRLSQLFVVDCLCVGVVQRTYETAAPALAATYQALAPRRGRTTPKKGHS
ncbi:MurR/RpiR family transcriptional regulator [Kitasatospora sp. NPDC096147]|uniref:MurR/RpiR family transcriptional regulator n=1 Tax=Kitasatospora sp. NPDC096147 TaxID=3364093 RepID=UPI0038300814